MKPIAITDEELLSDDYMRLSLEEKLAMPSYSQLQKLLASPTIIGIDPLGIGPVDQTEKNTDNWSMAFRFISLASEPYMKDVHAAHKLLVGIRRDKEKPFDGSDQFADLHTDEASLAAFFDPKHMTRKVASKLYGSMIWGDSSKVRSLGGLVHKGPVPAGFSYTKDVWLYNDAFDVLENKDETCPHLMASSVRFKSREAGLLKTMRSMIKAAHHVAPGKPIADFTEDEKVKTFLRTQVKDLGGIGLYYSGESSEALARQLSTTLRLLQYDSRVQQEFSAARPKNNYENRRVPINDIRVVLTQLQPPKERLEVLIGDYKNYGEEEIGPNSHRIYRSIRLKGERLADGRVLDYTPEQDAIIQYVSNNFRFPR